MVAGQCKERIQALSLWCPAPDLVYNLKKHLTLCGQDVSNIEKDGCADVEGLKLSLNFTKMHVHWIHIKRLLCLIKMYVPFMEIKTLASCECSYKYKEIFKERAKCIIVQGAEHRFKSFAFREARMKRDSRLFKGRIIINEEEGNSI